MLEENELLQGLGDRLADELELVLEEHRREVRKAWAIRNGRDWDPRPDLAQFEIDGQVWRWKDRRPSLEPHESVSDDAPCYPQTTAAPVVVEYDDGVQLSVSLQDLEITLGPMGKIIGKDNRKLISALTNYDLAQAPWCWIGPGLVPADAHPVDQMLGTGGKIYDRVVVTAGHVTVGHPDTKAGGWTPGADYLAYLNHVGDGFPFPKVGAIPTAHPKYSDNYWDRWDIGVLVLPDVWWVRHLGHFGVHSGTSPTLQNRHVHSYGYPKGSCVAAAQWGDGQCHGSMYGMKGKISRVWHHSFNHTCDSYKGQSGSPVFRNDMVIGVNRGNDAVGAGSKFNVATRIEKYKHNWLRAFRDKFKSTVAGSATNQGLGVGLP